MSSKPIYLSKTMWVNVIAMFALFLQQKYGFVMSGESQAAILIVINMILRVITKQPVSLE